MTTIDATAFVAEAERMTNERDATTVRAVFAPNARSTTIIDGLRTDDHGIEEIVRRWQMSLRFMTDRELFVNKELVASTANTIVNRWHGSTPRGQAATGLEVWTLDTDGLVIEQVLLGFLDPRPETSPTALLRLLLTQPRNALAFTRQRMAARSGSTVFCRTQARRRR